MVTVLCLLGLPSPPAVATTGASPPGTITTYAGSIGRGSATTVNQFPFAIAVQGRRLYVADTWWDVVRVIDTVTGDERVFAGTGDQGDTGDGGPALAARLGSPSGLAVSPDGELYVADGVNHKVRKIDASGRITTVVGTGAAGPPFGNGGPATAAHIESPLGIAFDAAGRLYVAESGGQRIRRVSRSGVISAVAGNGVRGYSGDGGPATAAGFDVPRTLAVDSQGRVYVGDSTARVRMIGTDGTITTVVGTGAEGVSGDGGPATSARIGVASALTFDPAGNLYVGDPAGRVRKVTSSGIISTVAGGGSPFGDRSDRTPAVSAGLDQVVALQVDGDGTLLIGQDDGRVRGVPSSGLLTTVAGHTWRALPLASRPAIDAQLFGTTAMATDLEGNLYLGAGSLIRKVDASGTLSWVTGNPASPGENTNGPPTTIMGVYGLAVDVDGTIYVAEAWRVLRVDPSGALVRLAGRVGVDGYGGDGGPASDAVLNRPNGIALDGVGGIYVGDSGNGRVRRIDPSGRIDTVAGTGTGTYGTSGDGGPAIAAQLELVTSVAVGRSGDLYLSDSNARRVRRVDPSGVITTVAILPGTPPDVVGPVALDGQDTVYVTTGSAWAPKVVRLDPSGPVVVAGNGTRGSWGDGGPATAAPLDPEAITFDRAGNLYLADLMTKRIRRVEAAGAAAPEMHAAGYNAMGQLGTGVAGDRHVAAGVATIADVGGVAAGALHTLATRTDGTVWAWGWNAYGQLGAGTTATSGVPRRVGGLTGVRAVAAGAFHSLALRSDGTVRAWGWNGVGALGTGTAGDSLVPVPVPGLTGVRQLAAGAYYHSAVLRTDGSVWTWGWNSYGQLGDPARGGVGKLPAKVPGLGGVTSIAAGAYDTLATKDNATMRAWGWNGLGQLGDGTTVDRHIPVRSGLSAATETAGGLAHTLGAAR